MYFRTYAIFASKCVLQSNSKTSVYRGRCAIWSFTMSHLVGRKYACFRHRNAYNIKEVQRMSKRIIYIVLCVQLQHTYIKKKKKNQSVAHSSLSPPQPPQRQSVLVDPVFWESDPSEKFAFKEIKVQRRCTVTVFKSLLSQAEFRCKGICLRGCSVPLYVLLLLWWLLFCLLLV